MAQEPMTTDRAKEWIAELAPVIDGTEYLGREFEHEMLDACRFIVGMAAQNQELLARLQKMAMILFNVPDYAAGFAQGALDTLLAVWSDVQQAWKEPFAKELDAESSLRIMGQRIQVAFSKRMNSLREAKGDTADGRPTGSSGPGDQRDSNAPADGDGSRTP